MLKVDEFENVGFGCTGPRDWRRAWRPGSRVSVERIGLEVSDFLAVRCCG